MNKARNLVEMGEFYASTVLTEAAKKNNLKGIGKDTFAMAGKKTSDVVLPKGLKTKAYDKCGPMSNENEKSLVKPLEARDAKGKKTFSGVENLSSASEKMEVETINNFMNKSIFDRLYEDVMSDNIHTPEDADMHDAHALDLPGAEGHEDGDEVTITLSKELAGKLHDALMAVLGSDEEQHGEEEGGMEDEGEMEEDAEEGKYCSHCGELKSNCECHGAMKEATAIEELKVPGTVHGGGKHPWELGGSKSNQVKDSWTSHHVDGKLGDSELEGQEAGIGAKGKKVNLYGAADGVPDAADTTPVPAKPVPVDSKVSKNVGKVLFATGKDNYKAPKGQLRDFRKL
jgi:hypothetical protein